MVLPIVVYGSPVLRKKTEKIDKDYPNLQQLISNMFETMYNADGLGLAAPQIDKSIRLFVVDTSALKADYPEAEGFKKVFINPEILETGEDECSYSEGCLSLPELQEEVIRKEKIRLKWYDENFELHEEWFSSIKARVIQHEYDHLEGIVFADRLSALKKTLIKGKLTAMIKGKVSPRYRVKFAQK